MMSSGACRIFFLGVSWHGTIDYTLVLAVRIFSAGDGSVMTFWLLARRSFGRVLVHQLVSPFQAVSPVTVSFYSSHQCVFHISACDLLSGFCLASAVVVVLGTVAVGQIAELEVGSV